MQILMQKEVQHTEIHVLVDGVGRVGIYVWRDCLGKYSVTIATDTGLDDCQIEVPKEKIDAYHGWRSDEYRLVVRGAAFSMKSVW